LSDYYLTVNATVHKYHGNTQPATHHNVHRSCQGC